MCEYGSSDHSVPWCRQFVSSSRAATGLRIVPWVVGISRARARPPCFRTVIVPSFATISCESETLGALPPSPRSSAVMPRLGSMLTRERRTESETRTAHLSYVTRACVRTRTHALSLMHSARLWLCRRKLLPLLLRLRLQLRLTRSQFLGRAPPRGYFRSMPKPLHSQPFLTEGFPPRVLFFSRERERESAASRIRLC